MITLWRCQWCTRRWPAIKDVDELEIGWTSRMKRQITKHVILLIKINEFHSTGIKWQSIKHLHAGFMKMAKIEIFLEDLLPHLSHCHQSQNQLIHSSGCYASSWTVQGHLPPRCRKHRGFVILRHQGKRLSSCSTFSSTNLLHKQRI